MNFADADADPDADAEQNPILKLVMCKEECKLLNFGAFVRIAPAFPSDGSIVYKYFEVFATNAEFFYTIDAPKPFGSEKKQMCCIIVMTKTGHHEAMKELAKLINGTL